MRSVSGFFFMIGLSHYYLNRLSPNLGNTNPQHFSENLRNIVINK
ncbi:hypothetical protein VVMO6_04234 [Vibrio vulnificus MO6-24/O]|nr:hypothetical protein VVMO6_04234 [Vibrio vulnificus MO6-24/O]